MNCEAIKKYIKCAKKNDRAIYSDTNVEDIEGKKIMFFSDCFSVVRTDYDPFVASELVRNSYGKIGDSVIFNFNHRVGKDFNWKFKDTTILYKNELVHLLDYCEEYDVPVYKFDENHLWDKNMVDFCVEIVCSRGIDGSMSFNSSTDHSILLIEGKYGSAYVLPIRLK